MKLLAHYTIFGGSVYHLHTFDCNEVITHAKVAAETPNTAFIQGLLIVTSEDSDKMLTEISKIIKSHIQDSINTTANKVAEYIKNNNIDYASGKPYFLLIAEYPDYLVSKINK